MQLATSSAQHSGKVKAQIIFERSDFAYMLSLAQTLTPSKEQTP